MKRRDLIGYLEQHGCVLLREGKHTIYANGSRRATVPRHTEIATTVTTFQENELSTRAFWHSRTPLERLQTLALLRQELFGDDGTQPRLQQGHNILCPYLIALNDLKANKRATARSQDLADLDHLPGPIATARPGIAWGPKGTPVGRRVTPSA